MAQCGVVSLGDGESNQIVAAVLLKPETEATAALADEIIGVARPELAARETPARIIFVDEMPTVLGGAKVQREVLQRRLAAPAI